jgi:hypothetical protein
MGKGISSKSASIPGPCMQDYRVNDCIAMVFDFNKVK